MNNIAIRVDGLGKQYRIGKREQYRTLRDSLVDAAAVPFRKVRALFDESSGHPQETRSDLIWALKDVSFEVPRGAVIGVIGRNGAGKSTLLRLLSRITEPTEGRVEIFGRAGSLLEVGTGFHPELSGRENIYLNGAILGMKRAEISGKFDEIVSFAEVEAFIDTPVKHYSSGMYMRLAFSVAAHLEPDILIVDEVLAVGDAQFQRKCLGKMENVGREGRTVLFVSHNMVALQTVCRAGLCLASGRLVDRGSISQLVSRFQKVDSGLQQRRSWSATQSISCGENVRLDEVRVTPEAGEITLETQVTLEVTYWNFEEGAFLSVDVSLYTMENVCVLKSASPSARKPVGLIRERCEIPGSLLNSLLYRVQFQIVRDGSRVLVDVPSAVSFEVREQARNAGWFGEWPGTVRPRLRWTGENTAALVAETAAFRTHGG